MQTGHFDDSNLNFLTVYQKKWFFSADFEIPRVYQKKKEMRAAQVLLSSTVSFVSLCWTVLWRGAEENELFTPSTHSLLKFCVSYFSIIFLLLLLLQYTLRDDRPECLYVYQEKAFES